MRAVLGGACAPRELPRRHQRTRHTTETDRAGGFIQIRHSYVHFGNGAALGMVGANVGRGNYSRGRHHNY